MSIERIKELLAYDADSGVFTWTKPRRGITAGAVAGSMTEKGYLVIRIDGQSWKAHRLAWLMHYGETPAMQIDHIDRNRANNRIANLRLASASQNRMNSASRKSASGIKGVSWKAREQRWVVQIGVAGKRVYGGAFRELDEARNAAELLLKEHHKQFAVSL